MRAFPWMTIVGLLMNSSMVIEFGPGAPELSCSVMRHPEFPVVAAAVNVTGAVVPENGPAESPLM